MTDKTSPRNVDLLYGSQGAEIFPRGHRDKLRHVAWVGRRHCDTQILDNYIGLYV